MKIKTIEMVRKIRNKNHSKCKNMSNKEKIEYTKKLAMKFSNSKSNIKVQKEQNANHEITI